MKVKSLIFMSIIACAAPVHAILNQPAWGDFLVSNSDLILASPRSMPAPALHVVEDAVKKSVVPSLAELPEIATSVLQEPVAAITQSSPFSWFTSKVKEYWKPVAATAAVVGAGIGAYKAYSKYQDIKAALQHAQGQLNSANQLRAQAEQDRVAAVTALQDKNKKIRVLNATVESVRVAHTNIRADVISQLSEFGKGMEDSFASIVKKASAEKENVMLAMKGLRDMDARLNSLLSERMTETMHAVPEPDPTIALNVGLHKVTTALTDSVARQSARNRALTQRNVQLQERVRAKNSNPATQPKA